MTVTIRVSAAHANANAAPQAYTNLKNKILLKLALVFFCTLTHEKYYFAKIYLQNKENTRAHCVAYRSNRSLKGTAATADVAAAADASAATAKR